MNDDLKEVIEKAKENREAVVSGDRSVKEANAVNNANHQIVSVYTLDLRRRMFEAEQAGQIERMDAQQNQLAEPNSGASH
jgi:hypothetical protein